METRLIKQTIPFTQVPNGLLYDPNISFKAKGIWAYMNAKPEGWMFSADRIAKEAKEERKAILAGLKELSENGYITAKKLKDGRIEYTLHWEVARTSVSEPEEELSMEYKPDAEIYMDGKDLVIVDKGARPLRKDFSSDKEYEKAFYKWNSR